MYKHLFTVLALVLVTGCAAEEASQSDEDLRGSEAVRSDRAKLRAKIESALKETTLAALADSPHPCLTSAMKAWDSNTRTSAAGTLQVDGRSVHVMATFDRSRNRSFVEALVLLDGKFQLIAAGAKNGILSLDEKIDVVFGQPSEAYPFMGLDACR